MSDPRDEPLDCKIIGGRLIMSIGIECLAHAIKLNPELGKWDDESGEWNEPEITDPDKFAKEVMIALQDESEDGTTLVHVALDKAAMNAIENGAEGIRLPADED